MKALVVNCNRNGLGVIRSLGKEGVKVIAVDSNRLAAGLLSKYVIDKYVLPSIEENEEIFVQKIKEIGKREYSKSLKKIVLFPVNDVYVLTFAKYWSTLSPFFISTFELDLKILNRCVNKILSSKLAKQVSVPIPKTIYSSSSKPDLRKLNYPVIVKPDIRTSVENINKQVFRLKNCSNIKEAEIATQSLEEMGVSYVVQEYILGGDDALYTAGVYSHRGKIKAIFTGRKLRQFPPVFGECSYGESVDDAEDIIKHSIKLMQESMFTGIAQIEFKKKDNIYYLMEINPRAWSWNSLTTYVGVNLPWVAYQINGLDHDIPLVRQTKYGTWIFSPNDFKYNVVENNNITLARFIKDFIRANCHSHLSLSDTKPLYYYIKSKLK